MSQKEAVLAARHDLLSRMGSIVADRQPLVQVSPVLTHTHDLTVMCSRHMLKGMCKQGLSSLNYYLGILQWTFRDFARLVELCFRSSPVIF